MDDCIEERKILDGIKDENMTIYNLNSIIRKIDYTLSDAQIAFWEKKCTDDVTNATYDFRSFNREIFTQNEKKRVIYSFPKLSTENILCHYLKRQLDRAFCIKYASRNRIVNLLFNTLSATKNMNDFVIVRADFKSFFDSVTTKFVYEKYILPSLLSRGDKTILEEYSDVFKYCYAGLCLSNGMTEIACREFDKVLKAKLSRFGLFFYERYVDDMLIMLNSYVSEMDVIHLIEVTIKETFESCPVRISNRAGKFSYLSRRNLSPVQNFNFLGYEFFIYKDAKDNITFEYGITEKKRKRYSNIIERAYVQYLSDNNEELLRQRVMMFSVRVVIARQIMGTSFDWLTKGVVANYNELKNYCQYLNADTEKFLEGLHYELLKKYRIKRPYFLPKRLSKEVSIYCLKSNLQRNRTLLFEEKIGIPQSTVVNWIKKLDPLYSDYGKDYYRVVMEYLEKIKIG